MKRQKKEKKGKISGNVGDVQLLIVSDKLSCTNTLPRVPYQVRGPLYHEGMTGSRSSVFLFLVDR